MAEQNKNTKIETEKIARDSNKKSVISHLRNINIVLFITIAFIMFASMFFIIKDITDDVSKDYAKLYADNAVGTLNTYLNEEIALITKASQSNAMIEWYKDEENPEKKQIAYEEVMSTISVSSSKYMYFGIVDTMHEYNVEGTNTVADMNPIATLSPDFPKDSWFFECMKTDKDYLLNVDIDKAFKRELVWLNCKVQRDGELYGVMCVGLEFSQILEDLFSEYKKSDVRSLIINEDGNIQMDSNLSDNENFFYALDDQRNINVEFTNLEFLESLEKYTENIEGYYETNTPTTVLNLEEEEYQYVTIAPIDETTWMVVTLYNSAALFDITNLLPMVAVILFIFILLIVATNSVMMTFFINPFKKLVVSIEGIGKNLDQPIYGMDREDEIGELANSVENMKNHLIDVLDKVHFDGLTGIHNRRYMDEHLNETLKSLATTKSNISILMIDIDHFKNYNDTYGHSAGDKCLKIIATTITKCVTRESDFVARYGGEEFIVILPNTEENGACFIANKILDATKTIALPHCSSQTAEYVTVSIGVKSGTVDYTTTSLEYIDLADEALYTSKQTGRNRYTVHS